MIDRPPLSVPAHVIVLGNEKGGSGKSTVAVHIIVALLKAGRRVASIDTDSRQLSLTRYLENRARWARQNKLELELPAHFSVKPGEGDKVDDVEGEEHQAFREIVERLGQTAEFIVIDTPASDAYRNRLAHSLADTLVTPINDSFVDLDVLGRVDPTDLSVKATSQYAELVRAARARRHLAGVRDTDWIVVRNRLSMLANRNQVAVTLGLRQLADILEFRIADGVSERVVFRELFPVGLTAFDRFDRETLGIQPTPSHVAARREISELVAALRLPAQIPAGDSEVVSAPQTAA